MPLYDFACRDCGTLTEVRAAFDELDDLVPACGRCGGTSLRRLLSTVAVLGRGRADEGGAAGCGGCASGCACGA